jgi:hypothetical protein
MNNTVVWASGTIGADYDYNSMALTQQESYVRLLHLKQ